MPLLVDAVYENGVLRPLQPLDLREHERVLVSVVKAEPISWRGALQQYVGRLHRVHHGKKVVRVCDYVDEQVPMLGRMYERRLKGYRAIGYKMESDDQNVVENVDTGSNIR